MIAGSLAFSLSGAAAPAAPADHTNVLFILDASNSMWGRVGKESKIEIARRILSKALTDLDANMSSGLMAYGHRDRKSCTDVETILPIATANPDAIRSAVAGILPKGKTPIAAALTAAAGAFTGREKENNNILLISDGIETCGGDPCAVATALARRGLNLRVHVVGFDVDKKARNQLRCVAEKGGGRYFDARDAGELGAALAQVKQEVSAVSAPAAVKPWFEDDFNGDELSDEWEIIRPAPDDIGLGDGVLTIVAPDGTRALPDQAPNVLRLKKDLPKGNWQVTARLRMVPQSFGEIARLGIADGKGAAILASLVLRTDNYARTRVILAIDKQGKSAKAHFERQVLELTHRNLLQRSRIWDSRLQAVELRLGKKGRKYVAALRFVPKPGTDLPQSWITTRDITSLRPAGNAFVFLFGAEPSDYLPGSGEGAIDIDRIWIETPE